MTKATLGFWKPVRTGRVALVFGDAPGEVAIPAVTVHMQAQAPAPTAVFGAVYDNRVQRGVAATTVKARGGASDRALGLHSGAVAGRAQPVNLVAGAVRGGGAPLGAAVGVESSYAERTSASWRLVWELARGVGSSPEAVGGGSERLTVQRGSVFQHGVAVGVATLSPEERAESVVLTALSKYAEAIKAATGVTAPTGYSDAAGVSAFRVPWEIGGSPRPGYTPPPDPNGGTGHTPFTPSNRLVFKCPPLSGKLVFGATCDPDEPPPQGLIVIPTQRRYFVNNNVQLTRVSDGAVVRADNIAVSTDYRSWTWQFSASVDIKQEALVQVNTELLVNINGELVRMVVADYERERQGTDVRTLRVVGRGRSTLLDSPFSTARQHTNTADRTMVQLMNEALTNNGVPLGYTVVSSIEDWVVPAGVWSFYGTPMAALTELAQAAGAYVLSDPALQTLHILPEYPAMPWNWAAYPTDIQMPVTVTAREGVRASSKPVFNRVFVNGEENGGVEVRVTRAGTDGGLVASPMIVHPLITTAAAGRQRGEPVLANTGSQREVSLRLPVLPSTGIILPGNMVEYDDGDEVMKGLVRSISVEATFPEVWQTIGVEVHGA